jgi:hypothetical protein
MKDRIQGRVPDDVSIFEDQGKIFQYPDIVSVCAVKICGKTPDD